MKSCSPSKSAFACSRRPAYRAFLEPCFGAGEMANIPHFIVARGRAFTRSGPTPWQGASRQLALGAFCFFDCFFFALATLARSLAAALDAPSFGDEASIFAVSFGAGEVAAAPTAGLMTAAEIRAAMVDFISFHSWRREVCRGTIALTGGSKRR